jgi:hypothetical protein
MVYGSGRYTDFASVLNPGLHGTQSSFKNGRVERTNFDSYEVTRIDAAPQQVRTHLINTTGAALASRACRPSRQRWPTRSTQRAASAYARCQSVVSWPKAAEGEGRESAGGVSLLIPEKTGCYQD